MAACLTLGLPVQQRTPHEKAQCNSNNRSGGDEFSGFSGNAFQYHQSGYLREHRLAQQQVFNGLAATVIISLRSLHGNIRQPVRKVLPSRYMTRMPHRQRLVALDSRQYSCENNGTARGRG
jgi:hypothetical protein